VLPTVVFLLGDMSRCPIQRLSDPGAFFVHDHTIGLCLVFYFVDMFLLIIQAIGFTLAKLAAGNTLINPLLLFGLSLVNLRQVLPGPTPTMTHRPIRPPHPKSTSSYIPFG
jgi:hypothetical protein